MHPSNLNKQAIAQASYLLFLHRLNRAAGVGWVLENDG